MTPEEIDQIIAETRRQLGVPTEFLPKHIAIIMDGNGRWATERGLPRVAGHEAGGKSVRKIITGSACLGIGALTLYSFSIENWKRPVDEVNKLMYLYTEYLIGERGTIMDHNIRLRHLGRREGLPDMVLRELDETVRLSADNTGMTLCLALNYGSRAEISDAVKRIARQAVTGEIRPEDIDDALISNSLDTAGLPDPDLVIRTSGEMRLSNFLLWQLSYAEFYVTDVHWPEFYEPQLHEAIRAFAKRNRRFGGLQ